MRLGWIDFSKKDRDKVLEIIKLLQEPVAIDELGIGIIRDAFSDYFFPGVTTVQTRAKYFLIVPYVLKEAGEGKYGTDLNVVLRKIDDKEKDCALKMLQGNKDGVIGSVSLPDHWVLRKPSDIYWNGIKRLGIFKGGNLSISEYLTLSLSQYDNINNGRQLGKASGEEDWDDLDAGDFNYKSFWTLPTYDDDWFSDLTIELLPEEAAFLRRQIEDMLNGTLYAYLLKKNVNVSEYNSFAEIMGEVTSGDAPDGLPLMLQLADDFNHLVYLGRVRYNIMLSEGRNEQATHEWESCKTNLPLYACVNLEAIYLNLQIKNAGLKYFLNQLQSAFLENDIDKADDLIRKREVDIKGTARAKLLHCGEYDPDEWVGGTWLDYRFSQAKRIMEDIYAAENA